MRFKIHPLFLVLMFSLIVMGEIALYSLLLAALIIHELGHIIFAYAVGAKLERCILLPYGGEITFENEYELTYEQWLIIALGGPLATVFSIIVAQFFLPPMIAGPFNEIQYLLLMINLLPIWPLDGGRIICYALLNFWPRSKIYETFLSLSLSFITIIMFITITTLPRYTTLAILSLFLWSKVLGEWRIRKYRVAFQRIVMKRLT